MNEYDLMNLYFNFIFKDGNKSFRDVYASYEQLGEFKNWLTKQNIKFSFGINATNSRSTLIPPTPESNTPIGLCISSILRFPAFFYFSQYF